MAYRSPFGVSPFYREFVVLSGKPVLVSVEQAHRQSRGQIDLLILLAYTAL